MEDREDNFTVECNCCGQKYGNWIGSTPCCGSVAYRIDGEGNTTKEALLFSNKGVVTLDFNKE